MVCETPRQKSVVINKRGTFFGDPFFRDSWADYNSAVRRIVDRFNHGWISPSERIRDSQYHSMYRTLRAAKQNYSTHSARFREEADCYKLIMDVHEFVGGDITVRTAGSTVSVRGKVDADTDGIASLRTEKGTRGEDSDASSIRSGKSTSSRTLHRRYTLPTEADCDKIESALSKDAVLTVTIPKRTDIRYIPLTVEGRDELSTKNRPDDRNSSMKRPNDSPLLSSRKKSQEEQESRANPPPWLKRNRDRDENKENSSANAESVSARRSRFEKFLGNDSLDENKEEKRPRKGSVARQRDKYEKSKEVIIPVTLSDVAQDKVFNFRKESDGIPELDPIAGQLPSRKSEKPRDLKPTNLYRNFHPQNDAPVNERDTKTQQIDSANQLNKKKILNSKQSSLDDNFPPTGAPEEFKKNSELTDQSRPSKLKNAHRQKSDERSNPWVLDQPSKRQRMDDMVPSSVTSNSHKSIHQNEKFKSIPSAQSPSIRYPLPHVSLCSPAVVADTEILINTEDNLKPESSPELDALDSSPKLDTLDTPKATKKNSSPSVTPGGREILVQKRQSLMEENMFQDCWSDFSNTLQDVLNRLQELSSELGQSKHLCTSLTELDSQNEATTSVSGIGECASTKMRISPIYTVNKVEGGEDLITSGRKNSDRQTSDNSDNSFDIATSPRSAARKLLSDGNTELSQSSDSEVTTTQPSDGDVCSHNTFSSSPNNTLRNNSAEGIPEPLSPPCQDQVSRSDIDGLSHKCQGDFGQFRQNNSSPGSSIESPHSVEPVLESKFSFVPVESDTQTSEPVNVLQPQKSIDLVSQKDQAKTAVPQSSSVCLTDNISSRDIPADTGFSHKLYPRLHSGQDLSKDNIRCHTVPNNVSNDSECVYSGNSVDAKDAILGEHRHKTSDVTSGKHYPSYDSLDNLRGNYAKHSNREKQRAHSFDYESNIRAHQPSGSKESIFDTTSKNNDGIIKEAVISSTGRGSEDVNELRYSPDARNAKKDSVYSRRDDTAAKDSDASHDWEQIVDILNADVMHQSAFSPNGANSPRYKSSHLNSAKSGARRIADLQREKKPCASQERCDAKATFVHAQDMGGLLTRGKEFNRGAGRPQPTASGADPVLIENNNPLRYSYKKENSEEAAPPVPSYVRQKSQQSRRPAGFSHVNSNNVRRMRDAWSTKPDTEDSEPNTPRNRSSPSPSRSASSRTCSPGRDNRPRCRSPSPMRNPVAAKGDTTHSTFGRSSPVRQRQSFSPTRDETEGPMSSRDAAYKRSAQKASYFSPTFSSSQKTCAGGNGGKSASGTYTKCSSQDPKPFSSHHKPPRNSDSPLLAPKNKHKENSDAFSGGKVGGGAAPERKRHSENSAFKPKQEPTPSPSTHHRIYKRFRNANLQPDSEAICFKEENEHYKMVLDVEEFVPGEIEVLQDEGVLTVKGKVENKDGGNSSVRTFRRSFDIPRNSREEDIDSSLSEDGILTIFVPKKKERIIKIELVD